jgi:hypothetical protein
MTVKHRITVITREKARFWLDGRGKWHSDDGPFQHPKIIEYFHVSIARDKDGYHVTQKRDDMIEKVYFRYEDTPLFAFDLLKKEEIFLLLNTKKRLKLKPKKLFIKNDSLYMHSGDETVKFTDRALLKLSPFLEYEENTCAIRLKGRAFLIPEIDV